MGTVSADTRDRLEVIKNALMRRPALPGWLSHFEVEKDIRWLVDEVERLRKENETLRHNAESNSGSEGVRQDGADAKEK